MKIVADTNIFLAVALGEPERERLIQAVIGHELIAPEVLPFELGNALTAMTKKQRLSPEEVVATWDIVSAIPVELRRIDMSAALALSVTHGIYAYDAYYLECAVSHRAPLLTLDKGMRRVAQSLSLTVMELPT